MTDTITIISLSLSGVASIFAILSPILTMIINNNHQRKTKKAEKLFDLKYEKYQKFFSSYAEYTLTNQYQKEELIKIIMDCLLISNEETTRFLKLLLRKVNGETQHIPIHQNEEKITFKNCIQKMKQELNML